VTLLFLANLYAFGVIWSFAMNGLAVLVLRYTSPGQREFQVPLNFTSSWRADSRRTRVNHLNAVFDRHRKPVHQAHRHHGWRRIFHSALHGIHNFRTPGVDTEAHPNVEMDQFNLELESELTPEAVGARPRATILVPISNHYALYHLGTVLDRLKPGRRDLVVLHVRLLRPFGFG